MALKKKWYEILASNNFGNAIIGESLAYEDKSLIGRIYTAAMAIRTVASRQPKIYLIICFKVI